MTPFERRYEAVQVVVLVGAMMVYAAAVVVGAVFELAFRLVGGERRQSG